MRGITQVSRTVFAVWTTAMDMMRQAENMCQIMRPVDVHRDIITHQMMTLSVALMKMMEKTSRAMITLRNAAVQHSMVNKAHIKIMFVVWVAYRGSKDHGTPDMSMGVLM